MIFEKQIAFVNSFEGILNDEIEKAVQSFGFVIKDYVINKQLFRAGVDGTGKKLRGYKRTTIRLKIATGQPSDRTTLRQDGSFYASIQINAYNDSFEVASNVSYDKYLLDPNESYLAYGYEAITPSKENMKEFFDKYVIPSFKKTITESLK